MSNTLENKNESKYQDYISTSTRSMRLNDEHNKLMSYLVDNKLYLFLNELLQSSLNMIGTKFPYEREYNYELKKKYKQKYDQVLKEHDEWKLFKRDKRVVQLADSIPLERAYTETISERNKELSSLVATDPQEGYYEGGLGGGVIFNIYKDKGDYYISGFRAESITYGGGNGHDWEKPICTFNGKLDKLDDGWYQLKNNDIPSIFLLFADDKDNSAVIKYVLEHGGSICGHKGIGGAYHHISKEFLDVRNIYKQVDKIIKSNVNPTGSTPKKQVDKVIKSNVDPRSTSPKKGRLKLTDNLHNQFLAEDNDYALADAMLNATWKMVRKNLDKSAFASIQKSQREWASSKRDERAASYAASMPPSQAYTKVMQERIAELSSLVAREPRLGDYEGERQMFNISKDKGEYKIDGSADNTAGNTCMFEGLLTKDGGWYKVHEGGLPPYYVLFTDKGAFIQHLGSGSDYGCGANVDFKGEYTFTK